MERGARGVIGRREGKIIFPGYESDSGRQGKERNFI